jgi:hypothetical protein
MGGKGTKVYQVKAPDFTAGIVVEGQRIVKAAPIIGYATNMSLGRFRGYVQSKGWELVPILWDKGDEVVLASRAQKGD